MESLREIEMSDAGKKADAAQPSAATEAKTARKLSYAEQKEQERILRKAAKAVAEAEAEVERLENTLAEVEAAISAGASDEATLTKYTETRKALENAMSVWELATTEQETLLEKIQN